MELIMSLITLFCSFIDLPTPVTEIDIPIIMYHHIENDENIFNEFMVTSDKFESDMRDIKELGYESITYQELYDFVNNGGDLPEKPIILTFDDGYESNYTYGFPVLKDLNLKATIAIVGNMVGKDMYKGKQAFKHFTYEQAKEMYDSGLIDIQSHTYDLHDISSRVGIKRKEGENEDEYIKVIKDDLTKSINELHDSVGNKQFVFTYPYGAYDYLTEKIVKELGFEITVTTDPGINHIVRGKNESLYKLKRFDIKNDTNLKELLKDF